MKQLKKCVIIAFIIFVFLISILYSTDSSFLTSSNKLLAKPSPCGRFEVEIALLHCELPFSKDELFIKIRNLEDTENEYMGGYLDYGSFYLDNNDKEWTEDDYSFSWIEEGFIFDFHGKYQDPIAYEVHWEDVDGLEMIFYD